MSDERILRLVSAAADDALSAAEQVELERLRKTSPEAQRFGADLEQLESLLGQVAPLDPPEKLHDQIMDRVVAPAAVRPAHTIFAWPRPLAPQFVLRYGLAAALGMLLMVVFYESQQQLTTSMDIADLVGTMAPNGNRSDVDILDTFAFHVAGIESLVQLERRDGALILDIQIDADEPVDIFVDFSAAGVLLDALTQTGSPLESIELAGHSLKIRALGRRRFTALLHRVDHTAFAEEAKITLEFSSNGQLLQQGSLIPAW